MCLGVEKSIPEVSPDEPPQAVSVSATSASSTAQTMRARDVSYVQKKHSFG